MNLHIRNRTLGTIIKLLIAVLTGWYIYAHFTKHSSQPGTLQEIEAGLANHSLLFILVLLMMILNWSLESLKWKWLASHVKPISFFQAVQGVLAGVTIGTATPNRIGEFAGRIYSVDSDRKKDLLLVSFVASFCQVFVTVLAAVFFILCNIHGQGKEETALICGPMLLLLIFSLPFITGRLPKRLKSKAEILDNFPPKLFLKTLFISALRYAVYATQFYLLMKMIKPDLELFFTMRNISLAYCAVTILPTFSITEVLVRGSIAGFCFGDTHLSDIAFYIAALLWTINVAIPSIIGIFFLFRLKFFSKE